MVTEAKVKVMPRLNSPLWTSYTSGRWSTQLSRPRNLSFRPAAMELMDKMILDLGRQSLESSHQSLITVIPADDDCQFYGGTGKAGVTMDDRVKTPRQFSKTMPLPRRNGGSCEVSGVSQELTRALDECAGDKADCLRRRPAVPSRTSPSSCAGFRNCWQDMTPPAATTVMRQWVAFTSPAHQSKAGLGSGQDGDYR